jgi:hypothetical protein
MSNECDRSPTYLSYMLRLWQAGSRGGQQVWRASLEDPHTGERQAFGDVEALVTFLADKTSSPIDAKNILDTFERPDSQEERIVP